MYYNVKKLKAEIAEIEKNRIRNEIVSWLQCAAAAFTIIGICIVAGAGLGVIGGYVSLWLGY